MYTLKTVVVDEDFTFDVEEEPELDDDDEDDNALVIKIDDDIHVEPNSESSSKENLELEYAREEPKDRTNSRIPESPDGVDTTRATFKPLPHQKLTLEQVAMIEYSKKLLSDGLLKVPYVCPICEFKMSKIPVYVTHLDSHIHGEKCYQCRFCRFATFAKAVFTRHKALCNYTLKTECPHCSFVTTKSRNLRKHVERRHLIRHIHICQKCGFKGDSREALKKHKIESHKRQTYNCALCDFVTKNKVALEKHQQEGGVHGNLRWDVNNKQVDLVTNCGSA